MVRFCFFIVLFNILFLNTFQAVKEPKRINHLDSDEIWNDALNKNEFEPAKTNDLNLEESVLQDLKNLWEKSRRNEQKSFLRKKDLNMAKVFLGNIKKEVKKPGVNMNAYFTEKSKICII